MTLLLFATNLWYSLASLDEYPLTDGLAPCWHALRIFYNRVDPLKETLENAAIRYFYPMHLVEKCSDGGFIYVQEPLIKPLMFVKTSDADLDMLRQKHAGSVSRTTTSEPVSRL